MYSRRRRPVNKEFDPSASSVEVRRLWLAATSAMVWTSGSQPSPGYNHANTVLKYEISRCAPLINCIRKSCTTRQRGVFSELRFPVLVPANLSMPSSLLLLALLRQPDSHASSMTRCGTISVCGVGFGVNVLDSLMMRPMQILPFESDHIQGAIRR